MTFASLLPELGKWLVEPVKLTARARMLAAFAYGLWFGYQCTSMDAHGWFIIAWTFGLGAIYTFIAGRSFLASRRATESLAEFCVRLLTEHGVSASVQRTPDEEAIEALLASLPREVPE